MEKELDVNVDVEKVETPEEVKEESKTFTEEEFNKKLQSATDKRVTEAIKTAKDKWLEEFEEKKTEAEKLASMSAEERARAEFQKEKDAWEHEKTSFEQEKLKLEAVKLLSAEGLPVSFVDYVVQDTSGTAEEVAESVKTFKESWEQALNDAVTDKLKGRAPSSGIHTKDFVKMTKEEFGNLPYKERSAMLNIDPDIVSKLKD